jgi:hypothetical protein
VEILFPYKSNGSEFQLYQRREISETGDYLHATINHGHFLWLKFGFWGNAIRLFILAFSFAVLLGSFQTMFTFVTPDKSACRK